MIYSHIHSSSNGTNFIIHCTALFTKCTPVWQKWGVWIFLLTLTVRPIWFCSFTCSSKKQLLRSKPVKLQPGWLVVGRCQEHWLQYMKCTISTHCDSALIGGKANGHWLWVKLKTVTISTCILSLTGEKVYWLWVLSQSVLAYCHYHHWQARSTESNCHYHHWQEVRSTGHEWSINCHNQYSHTVTISTDRRQGVLVTSET